MSAPSDSSNVNSRSGSAANQGLDEFQGDDPGIFLSFFLTGIGFLSLLPVYIFLSFFLTGMYLSFFLTGMYRSFFLTHRQQHVKVMSVNNASNQSSHV
jgi:hypothetical protein